jgi:predicted dehydrogenase
MDKISVVQWGTKHGHARGWLERLLESKEIIFHGIYEPDSKRQNQLIESEDKIWKDVKWLKTREEFLNNKNIKIVFIEESNASSLEALEFCVENNKHVMLDKPAGYNYEKLLKLVEIATAKHLIVEMGYMFRQHDGFSRIANWSKSGKLGKIFMIRAHMSTNLPEKNPINNEISREGLSKFSGGVLYDLGGHMLDQICWILGRPIKVTSFFKNNNSKNKNFIDNAVVILEFENAMSIIDIAAMESTPLARRFEVYGSKGSAIMEPFEPAEKIRLCLEETFENFKKGVNTVNINDVPRYHKPFNIFINRVLNNATPARELNHELLVQETLMRAIGEIDEKI